MSRLPTPRLGLALAAASLFVALLGASSASAATVVNGNFETGTLEGWNVYQSNPEVGWSVEAPEEEEPPLSGHIAFSEQSGPGTTTLSQDVALEAGASQRLQLTFGYVSFAPIVVPNPDSLEAEEEGTENQQVRVDVMKPSAPITSVSPSDILATVFASSESENTSGEGFPAELEPRVLTADLSAFAGQTVRLRIAVAVTNSFLVASVDDVSVASTLLPTPPPITAPAPAPVPPSNVFTKGKLTLNKKKGTALLSVKVPDAGLLTATDARRVVARASSKSKGKNPPLLIKTASVTSAGAGTVKVPIDPTAAGKKILAKKGKLGYKVELTFAPNGGTAAVQPFSGKLVKTLKPVRK